MARRRSPRAAGYHWDLRAPIVRDDGKPPCRWCKGPVEPPKRTFCSAPCVEQWRFRTSGRVMAEVVFRRDRGVCALCGLDTGPFDVRRIQTQLRLSDAWHRGDKNRRRKLAARVEFRPDGTPDPPESWASLLPGAVEWHRRLKLDVYHRPWEVDHVTPVVLGGDWFDLGNLRSLCCPCHAAETRALNDRLRAMRSAISA